MTFLVLLASLAVLEYILGRTESPSHGRQQTEKSGLGQSKTNDAPASLAGSLGRLGQAVDNFGRGSSPGASGNPSITEESAKPKTPTTT